jgi:hypothetical protein
MFKRIEKIMTLAACAAVLALTSISAEAAPQVVLRGQAATNPFVWVWVDGADRSTSYSAEASKRFQADVAGSEWRFAEDASDPERPVRVLQIGKNGQPFLQVGYLSNEARTFFLVHGRSGGTIVDGTVVRYSDDPSKGYGQILITNYADDGSASTTRIETALAFQ